MKQLLSILLLFGSCCANGQQGTGTIRVDAFYNMDNQIRHNVGIDRLYVCMVGPKNDTIVKDTVDLQLRLLSLKPGRYQVSACYEGYEAIFLPDVAVYADRITFVTLLFEPKKKHRRKFQTGR
jgi:hypothetical protein